MPPPPTGIYTNRLRFLEDSGWKVVSTCSSINLSKNSKAATELLIKATRYFLLDARSSRKQIQFLERENNWLYDKYRSKDAK